MGRVRGYQEIEVYENQRYRPLFGWGSKGYLLPHLDRLQFTNETGEVKYDVRDLEEISPPSSYEWATIWKINYNYTTVDEEGWSYSSSFIRLSQKFYLQISSKIPRVGHVVRRRLWTRFARPLRASLTSDLDTFNQPIESNPSISPINSHIGEKNSNSKPLYNFHFGDKGPNINSPQLLDSPRDGPEIITAIIYENERLGVLSELSPNQLNQNPVWSSLNLSDNFSDWPPFSDATGKHEVNQWNNVF